MRLRVPLGAGAVESLASNGRFVLRARAFGYRSGVQRSDEAQNQLFDFSPLSLATSSDIERVCDFYDVICR